MHLVVSQYLKGYHSRQIRGLWKSLLDKVRCNCAGSACSTKKPSMSLLSPARRLSPQGWQVSRDGLPLRSHSHRHTPHDARLVPLLSQDSTLTTFIRIALRLTSCPAMVRFAPLQTLQATVSMRAISSGSRGPTVIQLAPFQTFHGDATMRTVASYRCGRSVAIAHSRRQQTLKHPANCLP